MKSKTTEVALNIEGCVLSPALFSAQPNDASCCSPGETFYTYAPDMALVAHVAWLEALQRSQHPEQKKNL